MNEKFERMRNAMSFKEIANSNLLWVLVIVGIVLVAGITMYYYIVCNKHALKVGVTKDAMKAVIKSSILFSIVPSLAIVVGLASLVVVIGLPYGWFRLSVLGSVTYEIMAANLALSALGLDVNNANGEAFGLMAWAMCIGITITMVFNIYLCKRIHLGTLKLSEAKDQKWAALSQSVFMTALMCALVVPLIFGGAVSVLTFASSIVIAMIINFAASKTGAKWLSEFVLAFSLIGAMGSSILWNSLFS